jgi:hypothetical protein
MDRHDVEEYLPADLLITFLILYVHINSSYMVLMFAFIYSNCFYSFVFGASPGNRNVLHN